MTFIVKIKDKEIDFGSPDNWARWHNYASEHDGKFMRLVEPENKRSSSQNRYYWEYLEIIEMETGNDANDLHEYFKRLLLPPKWLKVLDKEIKVPSSTTDLNKQQFSDYLDKICSLTNVPLPDPIEAGYLPN